MLNFKNVLFLIFAGLLGQFTATMSFLWILSSVLVLSHYIQRTLVFWKSSQLLLSLLLLLIQNFLKISTHSESLIYVFEKRLYLRIISNTNQCNNQSSNQHVLSCSILHLFWKYCQSAVINSISNGTIDCFDEKHII